MEIGTRLGLVLILGSVFLLTDNSPFPGLLALPAVLGATLIIYCATPDKGIGRLLASSPLVGIGLISYSLYLWHQPLFALARIHNLGEVSRLTFLALLALSFALACLTWRFVERPFRDKTIINLKILVLSSLTAILTVFAIGTVGHLTNGFARIKYNQTGQAFKDFEARLGEQSRERKEIWEQALANGTMSFGKNQSVRKIMVIGDSRAGDLFTTLWLNQELFPNTEFRHQHLDELSFSSLMSNKAISINPLDEQAKRFKERLATDRPDIILVSCGWLPGNDKDLEFLLKYIDGIPCIVFGTAAFNDIRSQIYTLTSQGITESEWEAFFTKNVHVRSRDASQQIKRLTSKYNFRFIDTYEMFEAGSGAGDQKITYNLLDENGDSLLTDQTHLTVGGAMRFGATIVEKNWLDPK